MPDPQPRRHQAQAGCEVATRSSLKSIAAQGGLLARLPRQCNRNNASDNGAAASAISHSVVDQLQVAD
jgi:hypothetical protein